MASTSRMPSIPDEPYVLSGSLAMQLRSFCSSSVWTAADLDEYASLLQKGPLSTISTDFESRSTTDGVVTARKSLADIGYGPTKIPIFNFILQLTVLNPPKRSDYMSIVHYLALEAKVPVDSADLSGTTAFMYAISTKPYWDPEFADIMLEAGAEVNRRNRYGCTAAHDIAMARDFSAEGRKQTFDALSYFIGKGGNMDIADGDGLTARSVASRVQKLVPELRPLLGISDDARNIGKVGAKKVGRNDPCPCGKGKKYKQCCGKLG